MKRTLLALAMIWTCVPVAADTLHPGHHELGLRVSTVTVEGETRSDLGLRYGPHFAGPANSLWNVEAELGHRHQLELDELDLSLALGITHRLQEGAVHPYAAAVAGIRQEWLGSFQRGRYPVGFDLGARVVVGERALFRAELRYRRVLGDDAADFNETRFGLGFGVLFGG